MIEKQSFIDRFVPPPLRNSIDDMYRARNLVSVSIAAGLVLLSFCPPRFLLHGMHPYPLILTSLSLICLVTPAVLYRAKSVSFAGMFLIIPNTIGVLAMCIVDGGVLSSTIFAIPVLPLFGIFFVGLWFGLAIVGVTGIAVLVMAYFADAPWIMPMVLPRESMLFIHAFSSIGLSVVLVSVAYAYVRWQRIVQTGLEAANTAKNDFLSGMSHEIRTPLNSILGFTELLKAGYLGELTQKQQDHLGYILNSTEHLTSLVDDLLDMSKIEADQLDLSPREFDVRQVVEGIVIALSGDPEKASVNFDAASSEMLIRADETRFRQIVLNLVSNALKFTPADGEIRIRIGEDARHFLLVVEDTGPGISDEHKENVFGRFYQVKSSLADKSQGSGLGLFISRRLAELHGGTLTLDESYKDGCRMVLMLPRMGTVATRLKR